MTIFTSKDPADRAAGELTLLVGAFAATMAEAHAAGRQAAYRFSCELAEARCRADELGRLAIRAVRHVASLEAEVRRLRVVLEQRQGFIDRKRGAE